MTGPRAAPDDGSAGLLTLMGGVVFAAVALLLVVAATDVGVAAARARTAADAAALAGAAALPLAGGDGDLRGAAAALAEANGARLVACCAAPAGRTGAHAGPIVVVEVGVRPRLRLLGAMTVPARAAASVRPDD